MRIAAEIETLTATVKLRMTDWRAVCDESRKHGSERGGWKRVVRLDETSLAAYSTVRKPPRQKSAESEV
jgi:hypothetical protein